MSEKRYALLNQFNFIGRLTADAEFSYLENGNQLTKFSVAIDGSANKGTEAAYISCSKFGDFGVSPYLKKGQMVCVTTRVEQSRAEKNGVKQTYYNFPVIAVSLVGSLPATRAEESIEAIIPLVEEKPKEKAAKPTPVALDTGSDFDEF